MVIRPRPASSPAITTIHLSLVLLLLVAGAGAAAPRRGHGDDDGGGGGEPAPTTTAAPAPAPTPTGEKARSSFVGVDGTQFVVGGGTLYVSGFNAYWLMLTASEPARRGKVVAAFRQAAAHGLNLARTWAFSDGGDAPLQRSPGVYDEAMFRGLDFVVHQARRHGVYLLLCLTNNFPDFGGKRQYVRWAREHADAGLAAADDFYNSSVVKGYYKNHVKTVLTRVNSFTGVAYKDDPTIFGWELMNEPRCDVDPTGAMVQAWVEEMAPFVKSVDGKHLVTVGLEGFYGDGAHERKDLNPWRIYYGTNYIATHAAAGVDFATIHLYPDVWLWGAAAAEQAAFLRAWMRAHVRDTRRHLAKPLLLAEYGRFGWNRTRRDRFLATVLDAVYESAAAGGPLVGGAFWQLLDDGMDALRDGYEIILVQDPDAAGIIRNHSRRLAQLNGQDADEIRRRRSRIFTPRTHDRKMHIGSSVWSTHTPPPRIQILFVRFISLFRKISSFFLRYYYYY